MVAAIVVAAVALGVAIMTTVHLQKRQQAARSAAAAPPSSSACEAFAASSRDAVDRLNAYIEAVNQGRDTTAVEAPAVEVLERSADDTENKARGALSQSVREGLNAYTDAARDVAGAIRTHAGRDEFNKRAAQLTDTKNEAVKRCQAS